MDAPREPLRILQILRAPVGGLFRHVYDLTEALAQRGHLIGIVADSLTGDALTAERLARLAPFAPLGIHKLPMPRTIGSGDLTTPLAVRRLAREARIDVLHGHGAKGGLNARMARGPGQVALNTPHGGVLNYRPGSLIGTMFRWVERGLAARTDAYVFESAFAQRAFHEQIGAPGCREAVIHNGLAMSEFAPVPPDGDAHDFLFIGEFRPIKGIGFLLDALEGLVRPDGTPATLAMAGGGPEFEQWRQRIERGGLADRVELLGVRPARDAMRRGNHLVVPSLAESLPYVILEGIAAGREVIATNVGGVAEIYGPTSTDLLPPSDGPALRQAMQALLDDPHAGARRAAQRLDYVRPRFSITRMTDEIEALYREVLARRRGGI